MPDYKIQVGNVELVSLRRRIPSTVPVDTLSRHHYGTVAGVP